MTGNRYSNHLASEKSPYLLQHANNPVNWYPWGDEAFEKAKREDKSIFLSIGYATCHWCHVMAHESFEDTEVAALLNENFISIKVDREERPDIDNIYMTVCQMMTNSGGWPLTIIMTPEKKPYFAATYIPKENRWGMAGLIDILTQVTEAWNGKRAEVMTVADETVRILKEHNSSLQHAAVSQPGEKAEYRSLFDGAYSFLERKFDPEYGGFNRAPKFPSPHNLLFLLRYGNAYNKKEAGDMVGTTLTKMRMGGIFDHLGFGFHRYSTDQHWLVPHYEKMLYDQAMIALAALETYLVTGDESFASIAREIFTYVLRDMTAPEGGFYSAEDADSEGVEGKFYTWKEDELAPLLGAEDGKRAVKLFAMSAEGNFLDESVKQKTGANILHHNKELNKTAGELGISLDELRAARERIREKMFLHREKRIHPGKDDKILTDWNGIMIAALAQGARVLNEPKYREAAERAAGFILKQMLTGENRLLHRYRDGEAAIQGTVDDYAFFTWGLIELYETTFDAAWLQKALDISGSTIENFADKKNGGLYFTPHDGEELLVRVMEFYDGAVPSGNSAALYNFIRLGRITADKKWEDEAHRIANRAALQLKKNPAAYTMFLSALETAVGSPMEIVIAGDPADKLAQEMLAEINKHYLPGMVLVFHPVTGNPEKELLIRKLAPYITAQTPVNNKATAYVCRNYACDQPTNNIAVLKKLLRDK
ncbi:MAG: thioredoxin domain-containing protein [bacterium]|nr:thioredoxin domain-containing protein [bacterium]